MTRSLGGAWALALACGAAHANRPLNTDTADTIPEHRCQFEPYAALDRQSGSSSEHDLTLQINCGVTARTQLGSAVTRSADGDGASRTWAFAGKTQLVELRDDQTGVSIGYGLNAVKPPGNNAWSQDQAFAYLIATRSLTPSILGHLNLGMSRSRRANQNSLTWAAALEWTLRAQLVWSAESYGDDRHRPWLATGLWWGLSENFSVNVSAGAQTSNPSLRQVTAGFNVEF